MFGCLSTPGPHVLNMAEGGSKYWPLSKVEWASNTAYAQFRIWRKEVERILNGPMNAESDASKINHIFMWGGGNAENLVEARKAEEDDLQLTTPKDVLDCLANCLIHPTFFREAREDFYNVRQKPGENTTTYYSRILELYNMAEFPENTQFLLLIN